MAWLSRDMIERLRSQGASHLVVSAQSVADFKRERAPLFAYLSGKYRKLMDDDGGLVFELAAPP